MPVRGAAVAALGARMRIKWATVGAILRKYRRKYSG